ncbi:MAG: YihY family inner membrane protein [Sedimentisphaerales bacterium]|nr:YihY family inner membrane protein [Sedimentisphaerales bacterium]
MLTNLLSTPTAQLGKASRFVVFQIKLWSHCARLLKVNRAGQQAAALSYHTIFGIVPLVIVMLWVFQLSPAYSEVGEKIKDFIYKQGHLSNIKYPDPQNTEQTIEITEHLDRVVANFFTKAGQGTITLISVVIVAWVAISLLSIIERAFNNIWHVAKGRSLLHRVINYWALLTLGPLLLGLGVYATTRYAALGQIQETILTNITPMVFSYLISTAALFLLYFVLPNTKVQKRAAIWGAAVAALVWSIAKWGFGQYVTEFIPYSNVYGVLGLIPLGVLWIHITWLIVLFGLQLTFTTQHLKSLDADEIAAAKKTEAYFIANDLTVMNIVREIAAAFQQNKAPVSPEVIYSKLSIPAEFGDKILNHLVESRIIMKTSEPKVGFVPAQEPANIKLSEIVSAVSNVSFAQSQSEQPQTLQQITQAQRDALAKHNLIEILGESQTAYVAEKTVEQDNHI